MIIHGSVSHNALSMAEIPQPSTGNPSQNPSTSNHGNTSAIGDRTTSRGRRSSAAAGYKRASRKGAARRFACDQLGCEKVYSRAEHLQRHKLNHNPPEIYQCDAPGCDQEFVRLDLLTRHKQRHTQTYTPRNRLPSFDSPRDNAGADLVPSPSSITRSRALRRADLPHNPDRLHDAATFPGSASYSEGLSGGLAFFNRTHGSLNWASSPMKGGHEDTAIRDYVPSESIQIAEAQSLANFAQAANAEYVENPLSQANFATWLFNPQTTYTELTHSNLPFLDTGLESTFNNNIHYDYDSLASQSQLNSSPSRPVESGNLINETRRQELVRWIQVFRRKQPGYDALMPALVCESGDDLPALTNDLVQECLSGFWERISPRLAIVHQSTFSPNQCPIFLLLVMLALGAVSLKTKKHRTDRAVALAALADVIIASVRWEILTCDDSAPPISLWVAQALLLLEFYEKLCSTRAFHERAHIYHSSFLTLLRRGSPLIGRAGSESPFEADNAHGTEPKTPSAEQAADVKSWWIRWVETESMHRVVYAAFMLDVVHAAMFGHVTDMAPNEIRLPLPCDDCLWTAESPDVVRHLEANFRMYGVKQVTFLDGLKSALHGKEVKTHSFGRMIIMSGLLSVGWHLRHGESHLKWAELRGSSGGTQDNWRTLLLKAFDNWKGSLDFVISDLMSTDPGLGSRGSPNGPISSPSLLYHLAHLSMHSDIVDCQVYAGAKRILGRRISRQDYSNVVKRMTAWASQATTRHAVHHAFKLLDEMLVDGPSKRIIYAPKELLKISYSLRDDPDPHRPWVMYYAVLTIWAFVRALGISADAARPIQSDMDASGRTALYVSGVANEAKLDDRTARTLSDGLPDLLHVITQQILGEAETELLMEARVRLMECKSMLE